ncbi:DUF6600 domain-containing protein [Dokdonella fugitiva]|uniref:DUF6600 domain-containing protein n=1 Tax=Dokdonella fugitiva TaxID=328517 RepID=UPI0015FBA28F|nr:DUF6600 domain-containing protein [Dokdonella fugitiva]MBA8882381.1 hypothetical protein [Dokdonella fugitiva]
MYTKHFFPRAWCAAALATVLGAFAGAALADPPERVARVGFLRGEVSFQPAGDDRWVEASLNRPLGTGDKVYTDRDSRAEFEAGAAVMRIDERTTFSLLNLDDEIAQVELTEGVLSLRVRRLERGESYEVDTPTLAFVVSEPGEYRIDISPQGDSTMVTVFDGAGDVYGENNASYGVRAGNSYRFNDSALHDYEVLDLPRADDFDNWVASRNQRYQRSVSSRYVADDMIGYADLDEAGSWEDDREYGSVWYPTSVSVGWAPYRYGHWSWVDPWGWTWIDNAAWGFAPFHYGRWVYARNRWGWCPGPRHVRAVYAPALVAFVGGGGWGASISVGGGPIGWFPLGPRDVYVPWYRASRDYFHNVNVRNTTVINNTYITNVYNNYSAGRPITGTQYAYRNNVQAVTAVSRDVFVGARPVAASRVQVNPAQLRTAQVASRLAIAPTPASFVAANAQRARAVPQAAAIDRRVIARTAPPPQPIATAARVQAIQRNNAQPLARDEQRQLAARTAAAQPAAARRVQVVGEGRGATPPPPLPTRGAAAARQPAAGRTAPANPANPRGNAPAVAPRGENARVPQPERGLPSSRFAPHGERAQPRGNAAAERSVLPQREAPQARQTPPQRETREAPQSRQMPQREAPQTRQAPPQREVREAPQMRQAPPQREVREAPQMRQAPPQREVREAPQMRQAPPQREVREAPQMRQAPPQREVREAPQMRQAPPQREVREAPQMRQAPPPREVRQAPQRSQPPERRQSDKKDDDDHRRR